MREFLAIVGSIAITLVFWAVISEISMHPFILLILVVISALPMMFTITYFLKNADWNR